ncbi:hypothetical protein CkaCkLH20_01130 [Colletotrichum karsti]|uniref:Thiaminase-2/PQQC domain-containing protein n=1 Tax=Colletotrichum karsti TaxID=1095194 RepID=A0A9P6LPJ9_9PEZI|nr:uncharacterized protein CkaCkLH20_01130 [Colletotrichum karsti]KAF9880980.1 hypothetical protein CkaCkLH20_01130 [Colletotrichum karsti]
MPLTADLLASDPETYRRATQSPFLSAAAAGQTPKPVLGRWLANDRLYIHAYIKGVGRLLSALRLPSTTSPAPTVPDKLVQWLVDALVNVRREEKFFVDTARRFGIEVDLPAGPDGVVRQEDKLEGLRRFEGLFAGFETGGGELEWLEGAVLLYATEKCYLDAWTGAREQLKEEEGDGKGDADGGALRREFIPNWSSEEFRAFVDELGGIIDEGVEKAGKGVEGELKERALKVWREVLVAEEHFWPALRVLQSRGKESCTRFHAVGYRCKECVFVVNELSFVTNYQKS